ncbi:MAG: glucose-1-phosphate adenylyltransferase [Bacteroidales bacterium]|nr:glucose-1-phosphate adenylyltransferase [Bacteroidales bacterium]MCF8456316.1 glucose-1-phosphate adenylyltransferase [Bacteroidales bacterium]
MKKRTLAIVLGGGQGSRLYPLTENRSKPAVPIAGKYRLVDIPISNCLNSAINRIFVLTQFNSASLNKHIQTTYQFDHFNNSFVDILAAEQTPHSHAWFQGTADAVRQCMHHFLNYEFEYALILSGDQLYQMDFNELIETHKKNKADISLATLPVSEREAPEFGILKTDSKSFISEFIEKPAADLLPDWKSDVSEEMKNAGREHLASMGIYVFNRKVLEELMADESTKDFGKEIIPQSIGKKKVFSFQYEGYWTDIGNIESFFEANLELTDDIPKFNLYDNNNITYTRARLLPPSKILGTVIERSIISDGCILLASKIEGSVIGIRSRIGKDTHIIDCYVMGLDVYQDLVEINDPNFKGKVLGIGERCYLKNCIIDKNCVIGDDVRINGGKHLANDNNDMYTIKDGIVVIKKGAVIPEKFML